MIRESSIPNILTVLRIVLTPVFLYLLYMRTPLSFLMAFVVFLIASLSDYADGKIARKFGYSSEFGKYMDPLADKILVSSTFIAFGLMGFADWWMIFIVLVRDLFITLFRSFMNKKGKSMRTSGIAKAKTTIQMIFIYTVLVYLIAVNNDFTNILKPLGHIFLEYQGFYILMLLTTMLTLYTGILYFFENKHVFKSDT